MKSIKSKVIATLFALCFALLGYSCQCEAQEKYEVISVSVETKEDKGYESDKTYVLVGGQLALKAVVETEPSGKSAKVNWSSNNENVTVDKNGLVTIKEGTTAESVEITATSAKDETKLDSITLTLYSIENLTITSAKDSVSINKTLQLTANIDSTPSNIPEVLKKVSWSSSDETIATVSDTGLVTAKETEGSVTITATLPGGKTETKVLQISSIPEIENAIAFYSTSPFTLKTNNTSKNWKNADNADGYIEYCSTNSDNVSDWQEWNGTTVISAAKNANNPDPDKYYIFLRGKENVRITGDSTDNCRNSRFVIASNDANAKVTLDGNMMNLLDCTKDYSDPANLTIPGNYCFAYLFYECAALATLGPDFSLPATTLEDWCYSCMFYSTSLSSAPALPATTLANSCYRTMFGLCSSLTSAPALPATTLADYCYAYMFESCKSLTSVPALPATTLAKNCYSSMFINCFSLKFSESKTSEYKNEFKLGDATNTSNALYRMFGGTSGTFASTPDGNRSYWTSNTIIPAN